MKKYFRFCLLILFVNLFRIGANGQSFTNPILAGFYPDPSICRVGPDYYIVNSSFSYYPGLPIFHSKDLLNWELISYALNRPEQLNLDGAGVSRGLFAPAITYHNGTFYIVCTLIDKLGNFIITATDPRGPWTNPVAIPVDGIDPSIFFDDNGHTYIIYNSIPPDNKPLHDGHRTIRIVEFDISKMKVLGSERILVNGGTDMAKKPVWIEGPHLLKKDGWYYLVCAEGGTGYNHSEVVFRCKTIDGPFISYEKNPILTQRTLDPNRKDPITTTGHADLVETPDGKWYAVFLGCRPYEGDYYNTGRETFMAPVEWKDGWPVINPGYEEVQYSYPIDAKWQNDGEKFNGNYEFRDKFNSGSLNLRYRFLRTVRENWYDLTDKKGGLTISLRPQTCQGTENPSFIGFHQPHLKGNASTSIFFDAISSNEKAGLMVFQNENHYYYICKSVHDGNDVVQLYKGPGKENKGKEPELIASRIISSKKKDKHLFLKIEVDNDKYNFYFTTNKGHWQLLKRGLDAKFLSTKGAGGFVGCLYAMYATSNGIASSNKVVYNWFECKNDDSVYK